MLTQLTITPLGTGEETKELLAKTMNIIRKSELDYQLTAMGTLIEGEWDEVIALAHKCHEEVKHFADRVITTITIDDRKDLTNRLKDNVLEIEYAVGEDLETGGLT